MTCSYSISTAVRGQLHPVTEYVIVMLKTLLHFAALLRESRARLAPSDIWSGGGAHPPQYQSYRDLLVWGRFLANRSATAAIPTIVADLNVFRKPGITTKQMRSAVLSTVYCEQLAAVRVVSNVPCKRACRAIDSPLVVRTPIFIRS